MPCHEYGGRRARSKLRAYIKRPRGAEIRSVWARHDLQREESIHAAEVSKWFPVMWFIGMARIQRRTQSWRPDVGPLAALPVVLLTGKDHILCRVVMGLTSFRWVDVPDLLIFDPPKPAHVPCRRHCQQTRSLSAPPTIHKKRRYASRVHETATGTPLPSRVISST